MTTIGTLTMVAGVSVGIGTGQMGSIGLAVILGLIWGISIGTTLWLILALRAVIKGAKPPVRKPSGTYDPWLDELD